nr:hypothetical protein [Arachnia propionica]
MKNWLRSHPLGGYIALAYAGSWILWLPALLGRKNLGLLPYELPAAASVVLNQLALFAGPFLASLVMTRLTTGSLKNWTASLCCVGGCRWWPICWPWWRSQRP